MENHQESLKKVHHYNHDDSCKFSRWTTKECYQFMSARKWHRVAEFYSEMVKGQSNLEAVFQREVLLQIPAIQDEAKTKEYTVESAVGSFPVEDRTGRWARVTFKIVLSYHGPSFGGWQKQPGLNTVQELVEKALGKFIDDKKAQQLMDKNLPLEGCAVVAGRTDKGVSACQQVCSFYTWRKDVKVQDIADAINSISPGTIRVVSATKVSREFHPNFSAKWRRYLYIFPLEEELVWQHRKDVADKYSSDAHQLNQCAENLEQQCAGNFAEENNACAIGNAKDEVVPGNKPTGFEVSRVNHLLRQIEGKLLSYKMFARDTKPSRNIGPPTECFVYHARAMEASLPCAKDGSHTKAMCIELVANRFLRKMVRVLVATVIREAVAGADDDALLKLMGATCRRATAPPAPPDGLCLVDVGYAEFDGTNCLIP
ncbi:unnamed protein product [Cuscuta epithymum]|uniref:tRNA pseudouridine synthase n=1 Tax=Cuscuta epithymum TaxID=186058 RepID=A0AAV0C9G9_9ASTE|nr:unnamed protein product [Cuscuta epithymum]